MKREKRLFKTLLYRATTIGIQQLITWIVFHRITFNLIILVLECIRCGYYYIYDWLWERRSSIK